MTLPEAYEFLDLPEGTDIQKVRSRFSEQYSEYRMQIDNAPTPNLRQRYEQNLALREEAFNLITGGASLDDSHDLPLSAPLEESVSNTTNIDTDKHNITLLKDALDLLSIQESSPPAHIKTAHHTQKGELKTEFEGNKIKGVKQAYGKELNNLDQALPIIDTWPKNSISQSKSLEDKNNRAEEKRSSPDGNHHFKDGEGNKKRSIIWIKPIAIAYGLLVLISLQISREIFKWLDIATFTSIFTGVFAIATTIFTFIFCKKNNEAIPFLKSYPVVKAFLYSIIAMFLITTLTIGTFNELIETLRNLIAVTKLE